MDELTIAIPFYQGVDFLRAAIDSVCAQTCADWRLLVVDDSGAREKPETVRDLVASYADDRITTARNPENLGMVTTWNRCIDSADTNLIALLHGDDLLLPGYVERMRELGARHPRAVALYCSAHIIDEAGRRTFSLPDEIKRFFAPGRARETVLSGEASTTALMKGNFIMCPTLCFRKSVLGERRFAHGFAQVQDLELTSRLLMDGETLVGTREVAYRYRRHRRSATALQSESRLRFDEEFRLFDEVAARADALGWKRTAEVSRRKRIIVLHLLYRIVRDVAALRLADARATFRYLRPHLRSQLRSKLRSHPRSKW